MKLSILICCYNETLYDIDKILLPQRNDVEYVVSHQHSKDFVFDIPVFLQRNDVIFSSFYGRGLSQNRNNSISHATGDICLIADDDVRYTNDYINNIFNAYKEYPNADVITFKIKTPDKEPEYKEYLNNDCIINKTKKCHGISSVEISFKQKSISFYNIKFDTRFGLGSKYFSCGGEEQVFMNDCKKHNLCMYYKDEYIVIHPYQSSGKKQKNIIDWITTITAVTIKTKWVYGIKIVASLYVHNIFKINPLRYLYSVLYVIYVLLIKNNLKILLW